MKYEFSQLLAVAAGGAIGAVLRFVVAALPEPFVVEKFGRHLPAGTLLVNMLGCLVIGVAMAAVEGGRLGGLPRLLVITGLLGSFTTFSTFGFDTFLLVQKGDFGWALLNVSVSLVVGLLAVWGGFAVSRSLGM